MQAANIARGYSALVNSGAGQGFAVNATSGDTSGMGGASQATVGGITLTWTALLVLLGLAYVFFRETE